MQIPKRRSQENRKYGETDDVYLTAAAIQELKDELKTLEQFSRPRTVEELSRAREMGDLSENAAYQMAKGRLAGIDGRIFAIKENLKRAVVIEPGVGQDGKARIGSSVTVETGGKRKTYVIVGAQETDPGKGRISHLSPIGAALIGHAAGDKVGVSIAGKETEYLIVEVN